MAGANSKTKKRKKARSRRVGALAVACLCGLVAWLALGPGFQPSSPPPAAGSASLDLHAYDWSALTTLENGRKSYTAADGTTARTGIDVSKHQGNIDWAAVAADGVDFAILRVGSRGYNTGEIYPDDTFETNYAGATGAGLQVGVYFYSQAVNEREAEAEAQTVLDAIAGKSIDLPVVMDYEEVLGEDARTETLTRDARTAIARAFCDKVRTAGYTPMLYSTRSMLLDRFDLTALPGVEIWVAEFNDLPDFPYAFAMWQYTPRGRVAGIGPDVDLNLWLGT